jgi:hypothetical protein
MFQKRQGISGGPQLLKDSTSLANIEPISSAVIKRENAYHFKIKCSNIRIISNV